jgi:transglutaminase-like putative cysteine protease
MIELAYILLAIQNMTPNDSFHFVDQYVESNIEYKFYYKPHSVRWILKHGRGDCTDKAILKCYILKKAGIPCKTVHGYAHNIRMDEFKHDFIQVKINKQWQSSEPYTNITGYGVW